MEVRQSAWAEEKQREKQAKAQARKKPQSIWDASDNNIADEPEPEPEPELGPAQQKYDGDAERYPLHAVAFEGRTAELKAQLEAKNADASVLGGFAVLAERDGDGEGDGFTPLDCAVLAPGGAAVEGVRLLLAKGADATAKDSDGWTALHRLADAGRDDRDLAGLLLGAGCDPAARSKSGWTADEFASRNGCSQTGPLRSLMKQAMEPITQKKALAQYKQEVKAQRLDLEWARSQADAMGQIAQACADAEGRADRPMPPGTRICVAGHGRGTYVRFERKRFGANEHTIRFDRVPAGEGMKTVRLKGSIWTVQEEKMDEVEAESLVPAGPDVQPQPEPEPEPEPGPGPGPPPAVPEYDRKYELEARLQEAGRQNEQEIQRLQDRLAATSRRHVRDEAAERKAKEQAKRDAKKAREEAAKAKRWAPEHWGRVPQIDGAFLLKPLGRDQPLFKTLADCLQPADSTQLGQGADASGWGLIPTSQRKITLRRAWRVQNEGLWRTYAGEQQHVATQMKQVPSKFHKPIAFRPAFKSATDKLPGQLKKELNEQYLLSGVPAAVIANVMTSGMNERYSGANAGSMFGEGNYFAEDGAKIDQYTGSPDTSNGGKIRGELYPRGREPSQGVHYVFLCRVILGCTVRTQRGAANAVPMDGAQVTESGGLWATNLRRDLAEVKGATTPTNYHSLLAELGVSIARFREIVVFHGTRIYPEYLIAYSRDRK